MTTRVKICRICMIGTTKGVISLFSVCNGSIGIYNKVMEVANVQISEEDGLPVWICYSCLVHLETSYQFKIQAEKSDQLFRNQLHASQKEAEIVDIDENSKSLQANCLVGVQSLPEPNPAHSILLQKLTSDQNVNQGHFMSLSQGIGDDHSDDHNGIKITNVMSQADQEIGNMICTESCTCIVGQDGTISSKCESCAKISSDRGTDEGVFDTSYDDVCIPRDCKTSAEVQGEGSQPLTFIMAANLLSDIIPSYQPLYIVNPVLATQMDDKDKSCEETSRDEIPFMNKRIEAPRQRYKCTICSKGFRRISHLQLHKQEHEDGDVPKSRGIHKCPICEEGFQFKTLLKVHLMSHEGIKPYKCDKCEKAFQFEDHLEVHKLRHNDVHRSKCHICFKTFKHKVYLSNHMINTHSDQSTICEHCGKLFKTYSGLHSHKQIHHSENKGKYVQCEQCGKSFVAIAHLKKHLLRHEDEPMSCEECNKMFKNRHCLENHKRLVHTIKSKTQCTICKKEFKRKCTLRVHINSKHSDKEKPKCTICNMTFAQPVSLRTHMRIIHSGLRPYSCKHCKMEFKWKQSRDKHESKCLVAKRESGPDGEKLLEMV